MPFSLQPSLAAALGLMLARSLRMSAAIEIFACHGRRTVLVLTWRSSQSFARYACMWALLARNRCRACWPARAAITSRISRARRQGSDLRMGTGTLL